MVIRSMTGYGRSERQAKDVGVEAEIRSVNGRHLSVRCRLPSEWMRFEPRVEKLVRANVGRGAVEVSVRIQFGAQARLPRIDESVLSVYRQAFDRAAASVTADDGTTARVEFRAETDYRSFLMSEDEPVVEIARRVVAASGRINRCRASEFTTTDHQG